MSKTIHHGGRSLTPELPAMQAAREKAEVLSESFLHLEDDVILAIQRASSQEQLPLVWRLIEDAYGDAVFDPDEASQLARECQALIPEAESAAAIWLRTIAAFAAAAGDGQQLVFAVAD
jgi:hypothetical protein